MLLVHIFATGVFLAALASCGDGQKAFEFATTCPLASQRFDIASLSCRDCTQPNSVASSDGKSCTCKKGYAKSVVSAGDDVDEAFVCFNCAPLASTSDGTACVGCNSTSGATYSALAGDCVCPAGLALRERNSASKLLSQKICVECPENTMVFSDDPTTCVGCPHPSMTINSLRACTCGTGYVAAGDSCVLESRRNEIILKFPVTSAIDVEYNDIQSVDGGSVSTLKPKSFIFENLYLWAAAQCKYQQNEEACQALGNLCALQKNVPDTTVCALLRSIVLTRTVTTHGFRNWKTTLPYESFLDDSILTSVDLQAVFKLRQIEDSVEQKSFSTLRFKLARYALNGTFLGLDDVTSQLQLCTEHPDKAKSFARFGTYYENKCLIDLNTLLDAPEPELYDLYFEDANEKLFPVPVKLYNLRLNNKLVNFDSSGNEVFDSNSIILNRRFFLYDNVSGKQNRNAETKVLVYAKHIALRTTMKAESTEMIYPPLLIIRYAERDPSSIRAADAKATTAESSARSMVEFRSEYLKDTTTFVTVGTVFFVVAMLLVGILWMIEVLKSLRSQLTETLDFIFIFKTLFSALSLSSDFLFWLAFLMCLYCFIFFKGQATAFFLLPQTEGSEENALESVIWFVFIAKLITLGRLLWKQVNVDVFFIDWEKARYTTSSKRLNRDDADEENGDKTLAPVSVWRKLFVANEYNELQIERTVNIELSLFVLLFFLRGINLEYLATWQPSSSNLSSDAAPINKLLRFAVTSSIFLLTAYLQRVYRQLIYHRYFEHKAAQFVDFLTMSNVSAFVLDETFHGYYIHGKTLHAFADASMEEMSHQLLMEKKEMVKRRGLVSGKDTFEVFVTADFRLHYMSIFKELSNRRLLQSGKAQRPGVGAERGPGQQNPGNADVLNSVSESLVNANSKLNRFLKNFIDRNSTTYRWEESERTFLEKLFNVPPMIKDSPFSIFYDDPNYRFMSIMLMGIEYEIIVFLTAMYAACDLAFDNTFVSILVVFLANRFISYFRMQWGQTNVSKKTLVDERFLI